MNDRVVDLRSDTVTRPTPAMRAAMADAVVGDDVFGDDPTVHELEAEVARILGKEAALLVPSGTMSNQIAIAAQTQRGDEIVLEATSHVFYYEAGAPAVISGVQCWPVAGSLGLLTAEQVEGAVRSRDIHFPVTRLVCLENTHNRSGGRVLPPDEVVRTADKAHALGLRMHLDGARLWNAAIALRRPEAELAASFDSISVCFSKGLGAPIGSAFVSDRETVERARRWRKRLGGGMRQAGILAAGALHALHHHRARLADDHRRAQAFAEGIARIDGLETDPRGVETNIVLTNVKKGIASTWVARLKEESVWCALVGPNAIRWVMHLDVDDAGVERALAAVRKVSAELRP